IRVTFLHRPCSYAIVIRHYPPTSTLCPYTTLFRSAPLAQLDRASVYGTEGQGFESLRARSIRSHYHADPRPLRLIADHISRAFRLPKIGLSAGSLLKAAGECLSSQQSRALTSLEEL